MAARVAHADRAHHDRVGRGGRPGAAVAARVGEWTSAEVRQRAIGDADAVSFGDYHVAKDIGWALTGTAFDDDELARVPRALPAPPRPGAGAVCARRPHRPRLGPADGAAHPPASALIKPSPGRARASGVRVSRTGDRCWGGGGRGRDRAGDAARHHRRRPRATCWARSCAAATARTTRSSSAPTTQHARAILEGLRRWEPAGGPDHRRATDPHDRDGLDFLRRACRCTPPPSGPSSVTWGDFASAPSRCSRRSPTGTPSCSLVRPERPRDEEFHGAVTDALDDWHLAQGVGFEAVRLIGEQRDERTHSLRDSFGRNHIPVGVPPRSAPRPTDRMLAGLGLERPRAARWSCSSFTSPPTTLVNPTDLEIADAFGLMAPLPADRVYDVVVVGAGPVRSRGRRLRRRRRACRTLVVEQQAVGGQAGTSSLIRNYPGFSRGVSGAHLAYRSFQQAWTFGTEYSFMRQVEALGVEGDLRTVLDVRRQRRPGPQRRRRHRRRLPPPRRARARGAGRARRVLRRRGLRGAVDDGGARCSSSAAATRPGQAALHLAKYARHVTLLVRGAVAGRQHVGVPHRPARRDAAT